MQSVQEYYKITRLSNISDETSARFCVQEYYKITRLSNPVLSSNRLLIVQEYYKITRLSNGLESYRDYYSFKNITK